MGPLVEACVGQDAALGPENERLQGLCRFGFWQESHEATSRSLVRRMPFCREGIHFHARLMKQWDMCEEATAIWTTSHHACKTCASCPCPSALKIYVGPTLRWHSCNVDDLRSGRTTAAVAAVLGAMSIFLRSYRAVAKSNGRVPLAAIPRTSPCA